MDVTEFFYGFTHEEWIQAWQEYGRPDESFEEYKHRTERELNKIFDCEDL